MNKTFLVAKETYRREVKTWAYWLMVISPIILILLSAAIGFAQAGGNDDDYDYVCVVTNLPEVKHAFRHSADFENYSNSTQARHAFKSDDIDGYVEISRQKGQLQATYHSNDKLDSHVQNELTQKLQAVQNRTNSQKANLTAKQVQAMAVKPAFRQNINKHVTQDGDDNINSGIFYVLLFVMYILALIYIQVTAQDIAREKGTKIMEVIFSSMPGQKYFDGKLLGIIGEILTQVLVYLVGGLAIYIALLTTGSWSGFVNAILSKISGTMIFWSIIFVMLGLILYVACAAFCGALAAKPEDANKAVQPMTTIIIFCFIIAIFLQNSPDAVATKILSYVPFISSFLMPLRIINGSATNVEGFISLVILLAFLAGLVIMIRSIYPNLILQTDDNGFMNNLKRALKSK